MTTEPIASMKQLSGITCISANYIHWAIQSQTKTAVHYSGRPGAFNVCYTVAVINAIVQCSC